MNGKGQESSNIIKIDSVVNTLRRLKDEISQIFENKHSLDRMIIYSFKGLEIDEVDIQYLKNDDLLFVSFDGHPFLSINYYNQYEFVKYIKSGGYGKVYIARNVITGQLVAIKKIETLSLCKYIL